MSAILFSISALLLWVNHRVYDAYIHAITREERWLSRRANASAEKPHHHFGPKFFLLLDFLIIVALVQSLWGLGLLDVDDAAGPLTTALGLSVQASLLMGLWVVLEGRQLQSFYQHLARTVDGLGEARQLAWNDPLLGRSSPRIRKAALIGALAWAAVPMLLSLFGVNLLLHAGPTLSLALFLTNFVLPHLVLGYLVARAVLPVRRLVYS